MRYLNINGITKEELSELKKREKNLPDNALVIKGKHTGNLYVYLFDEKNSLDKQNNYRV